MKASNILTSTLSAFLFSSHPKREMDQEAHLNYYASAYNRKDSYHTARQNLIKYNRNKHASLTKNTYNTKSAKKLKPGLVA